jgi:Mg2+-importing ATPase
LSSLSPQGEPANLPLRQAWIVSRMQKGLRNAMDNAILGTADEKKLSGGAGKKLLELPFDFVRRRMSVIVAELGKDGQEVHTILTVMATLYT